MRNNGIIGRNSLGEIQAALEVAGRGSFRAAAEALGTSPTALSSTIRSLEDRLGVRLFNRTTRSVALTPAGKAFLARVSPALVEIERAAEEARNQAAEPSGVLRINSSVTGAYQILSSILGPFLKRYPKVTIELTTETRLIDIVNGQCDAGIRIADSVPADMVSVPLPFGLDFCVVAAPDYLAMHPALTHPAELMHHPCLRAMLPGGGIYRWEFERGEEAMALDVPGTLVLDDQLLLLEGARRGLGIAYLARSVCEESLASGRLRSVLADWMPRTPPLSLYCPHNRNTSSALLALVDAVRSMARALDAEAATASNRA